MLSLGTGRYETAGKNSTTYTSLKAKLTNVISSATDTEGKTLRYVKTKDREIQTKRETLILGCVS